MFRLLRLLGGLSVVTDLGSGSPMEESLKRCLVATRLARALGCPAPEVHDIVYVALLEHLGCTAFSHENAAVWGDDIAATRQAFLANWAEPSDLLRTFVPGVAAATGRPRPRVLATALTAGRRMDRLGPPATCEVARDASRRLGLPDTVQRSLAHVMSMWNGKGFPPVAGDAIPACTRVMHVASTAVMFSQHAGTQAALEQVRRRSGTYLDPSIAAAFSPDLLDGIDELDAFAAVLDAEPDPVYLVDQQQLDEVARTFGDLADLKSPSLHGHSSGVGDLAAEAARELRLPDATVVRSAGYLHDVGRVGISSRIWDKPGPLTAGERDQVELHPYYSERILARVPELAPLGKLAGGHHERLDGSGYHRAVNGSAVTLTSRVLAAADRYRTLVEDRPHRAALSPSEAAGRLRADVRAGRLDEAAVSSVLGAAGHGSGTRRQSTAGLTERQIDVLRLVAAGLSNREIAQRLVISSRTAEHHVQDIYVKIGVSTRAGAALAAMDRGLVEKTG